MRSGFWIAGCTIDTSVTRKTYVCADVVLGFTPVARLIDAAKKHVKDRSIIDINRKTCITSNIKRGGSKRIWFDRTGTMGI
jgi:hypothetical protein